jgi:starvation-inducible DNA-binding protein
VIRPTATVGLKEDDMTNLETTLTDSVRRQTGQILQGRLVDLLALSLNVKQAHWHVTGRTFKQVHEQLDEINADVRGWSDDVAERAIMLDVPVDGRPQAVATSSVAEFPTGFLTDDKVVDAVAEQIVAVVGAARPELETLDRLDLVTQDLLIGIIAGLEKHLWMLRAQRV